MVKKRKTGEGAVRLSLPGGTGKRRLLFWLAVIVLLASVPTAAFLVSGGSGDTSKAYALAPESALPDNLRKAPPNVRDAYRFAIANRDVLRQIPCYCGCGAEHQSNAECYIKEVKTDGTIAFDLMSYG
jgi:Protein of unknown function with PCYCGC motif